MEEEVIRMNTVGLGCVCSAGVYRRDMSVVSGRGLGLRNGLGRVLCGCSEPWCDLPPAIGERGEERGRVCGS